MHPVYSLHVDRSTLHLYQTILVSKYLCLACTNVCQGRIVVLHPVHRQQCLHLHFPALYVYVYVRVCVCVRVRYALNGRVESGRILENELLLSLETFVKESTLWLRVSLEKEGAKGGACSHRSREALCWTTLQQSRAPGARCLLRRCNLRDHA